MFSDALPYASRRSPVFGRAVVATSQPLAAQAGLDMLAAGGNAMDAALAAAIALTVVEPTGCGVGSDAFCLYHDGTRLHGLNASGWSPAGWTADRFAGRGVPGRGWDSVTIPGAPAAWALLAQRFGSLGLERLAAPAVRLAREGFRVTPVIARGWAERQAEGGDDAAFAAMFWPDGTAPAMGTLWRNPDLAQTLEEIAATGAASFYRGRLADRMLQASRAAGGALTEADLADWHPEWVLPIAQAYGGRVLHEIPPNGQGIGALMALGILAHTPVAEAPVDSADSLHWQIEAMKLALADVYAQVADPAAMGVRPADLLDPGYLRARAAGIDPARAGAPAPGALPSGGTVYLAAADDQGRMVSFIQSNYDGFGSGVVIAGTGIHLQNRGAGFVASTGHPNCIGPRKRPFHTIIPGFLTDPPGPDGAVGAARMAFGVMGGAMQTQGHVQMVLRLLIHGQNPQAAVDAPRWRVLGGQAVAIEPGLAPAVLEDLAARGHQISATPPDEVYGFGGAQLIWRLEDAGAAGPGRAADYIAGSDPRKDGCAVALG